MRHLIALFLVVLLFLGIWLLASCRDKRVPYSPQAGSVRMIEYRHPSGMEFCLPEGWTKKVETETDWVLQSPDRRVAIFACAAKKEGLGGFDAYFQSEQTNLSELSFVPMPDETWVDLRLKGCKGSRLLLCGRQDPDERWIMACVESQQFFHTLLLKTDDVAYSLNRETYDTFVGSFTCGR